MKKNTVAFTIICLVTFYSLATFGGTLIYEDRSIKDKDPKKRLRQVTKVKIISISEGMVIIEKGGATRRIPIKMLKEFYNTDLKDGDSGDFDDNTAEYTVQLSESDIDMPKSGYKKSTGKSKHRRTTAKCTINYRIIKQDKDNKTQRVRRPYFYLYLYTTGPDEHKNRNIFKFYYPSSAKVKNKVYNRAEIMSAVSSFKRSIINLNNSHNSKYYSGKHRKLTKASGDRKAIIDMKGVKSRRILAYHLEVWGKNDVVAVKDWHESGVRLGKKWWIR
jgi:hypothetical protein